MNNIENENIIKRENENINEKAQTQTQTQSFSYIKSTIGFIIIYGIVLLFIPYYLIKKSYDALFITYFANVDLISNILAINFPSYFKQAYNYDPTGLSQNISYNIVSLVALSGIFIHGISQKNKKHSDINIFISMVIMSIVTWTLPTKLVPYIVKKFNNAFNIRNDPDVDVLITTLVSGGFILLEGILIYLIVEHGTKSPHFKFLQNIRFKF